MSVTKSQSAFATIADLIRDLGVPARRIRIKPLPGTAVEKDLIRINDRKLGGLCELIDGTLVEKAMGYREGLLAAFLIEIIGPFVRARSLGMVAGADAGLRLMKRLIRVPDVSFISWDQVPSRRVPDEAFPNLYPDLAIEVFSKGNTRKEMSRKRRDYFRAGTRLVWILYPKTETIEVYTSPTEFTTLTIGDTLDGGAVLPGFSIPVSSIFAPPPTTKPRNGKRR